MTDETVVPGEILPRDDPVTINDGRDTATMTVANTGDRPIQVGSHYHFFEVNRALEFDREQAFGKRLDILAGTAIRFEPGDRAEVDLVDIGGKRRVQGMNRLLDGSAKGEENRKAALAKAREEGFRFADEGNSAAGDGSEEDDE